MQCRRIIFYQAVMPTLQQLGCACCIPPLRLAFICEYLQKIVYAAYRV